MKMVSRKAAGQRRVYDIEVEGVHNFYANGVNVHNCATAGGVSVIKDDGTVVDSNETSKTVDVFFVSSKIAFNRSTDGCFISKNSVRSLENGFSAIGYFRYSVPAMQPTDTRPSDLVSDNLDVIYKSASTQGYFLGLSALLHDFSVTEIGEADNASMVAYLTSTYNTGWMNGDIKGAFLSDTDDTDLVGSGELVTNGTFDSDISGWSQPQGTHWVWSSGTASHPTFSAYRGLEQDLGLTSGKLYVLSFDLSLTSGGLQVNQRDTIGGTPTSEFNFSTGGTKTIILDGDHPVIAFGREGGTTLDCSIDNISVRLADEDRSVNNNGLIVNGTVTRSPVAPGADLVAYSGFSSTNYLEQPYNPDLDFGTGDFCVMGWASGSIGTNSDVFELSDGVSYIQGRYSVNNSAMQLRISDGSIADAITGVTDVSSTGYFHFVMARKDGNLVLFVNGETEATPVSNASNIDLATGGALTVGIRFDLINPWLGSLALLRISATAPTAEQIKKIYEDEKALFQENAQATLYGTSDAVTALAHDPVTDLLHVGTSDGRSVFQGLRRVDNTTDPVNTAISAHNGLIVEE